MSTKILQKFIPILLGILFLTPNLFGQPIKLEKDYPTNSDKSKYRLSSLLVDPCENNLPSYPNRLLPPNSIADCKSQANFGWSVDISGNTAVVGSPVLNAAYVYIRTGGNWELQAKLTSPEIESPPNDTVDFGFSVAISGDIIVVGDPWASSPRCQNEPNYYPNNGAVYVFKRNGTTWTQTQKLTNTSETNICPNDTDETMGSDDFGHSVDIEGNKIIVGASKDKYSTKTTDQGSASLYVRTNPNANFTLDKKYTYLTISYSSNPSDSNCGVGFPQSGVNLGTSVGISSDQSNVIIGDPSQQGRAFIIDTSIPTTNCYVKKRFIGTTVYFGNSVSIDGNIAAIGSKNDSPPLTGRVYTSYFDGNSWSDKKAMDGSDEGFGTSVSVKGNLLVAGVEYGQLGVAYLFYKKGIAYEANTNNPYILWGSRRTFRDNYDLGNVVSHFGNSVALDKNMLVVGAISGRNYASSPVGTGSANVYYTSTNFDYDGDKKSDISVFRPSNGGWYINQSANNNFYAVAFGANGDKVVPADFSGDGKTDVGIFRPSNNTWYVFNTADNTFYGIPFGTTGDIPVPEDFDGDGKADINVFRPSTGYWYRYNSSNGQLVSIPYGQNGDVPTVGDFDGDGKADIAVWRPSNGVWYRLNSSDSSNFSTLFGQTGDKVVPADYTGDDKTDLAVFRAGTWFILRSEDNTTFYGIPFGLATDVPSPGDYDGDGKADQAVYRDGQWFIQQSTNGFFTIPFGLTGDTPTPSAFVY